jgi:hypothetical protein
MFDGRLLHESNAATLVSLGQTAKGLPVLLLAMPGGVVADTFDRHRLLIGAKVRRARGGWTCERIT